MTTPLVLDAGVEPIAGYKLVRELGRGGFGVVWEASAPGGFHIALKFIPLDGDGASVEQRSLDVIRNIRHPHLLDVQFATRIDSYLVIATPLCDQSLRQRLRASPTGLPRDELLSYMDELARAVDFLNECRHRAGNAGLVGVQHRDIKPDNIFLVGGSARLADFGLAKILAATSASHTGLMSVRYVAPEVFEGRVASRSDQYSLAVTYCQLRTGRLPFECESEVQFMYAHVHTSPDLSGLPEAERPVVGRALSKRPEDRWPSCRDFALALEAAARGEPLVPASGDRHPAEPKSVDSITIPVTKMPPPIPATWIDNGGLSSVEAVATGSRRRWLWLIGLAAGLSVLGALAVIPRLGPPTAPTHPESMPLAKTNPPDTLEPVKSPEALASHPTKPDPSSTEPTTGRPESAKPPSPPTVPAEPPKQITSSIGMKLMLIPYGEFLMGSPDSDKNAQDNEKPRHTVRIIRPFYLGSTEVTVGQFRRFVERAGYLTEAEKGGKGGYGWNEAKGTFEQDPKYTWRNPGFAQTDEHPVVNVSWNDAMAFCANLSALDGLKPFDHLGARGPWEAEGYRLPTEAEWEYACRAGTTTRYESGDDPETLATVGNIADATAKAKYSNWTWAIAVRDGYLYTVPVGRFRTNAFGLYDMHGNVSEWCWDGYTADYYEESPGVDPVGPSQAVFRVIRGGSWDSDPQGARAAYRNGYAPVDRGNGGGFRVARVQSSRDR